MNNELVLALIILMMLMLFNIKEPFCFSDKSSNQKIPTSYSSFDEKDKKQNKIEKELENWIESVKFNTRK